MAKKVDTSAENVIDNGDGTKTFNLALTDLPTTELTTEFAARAYATYTVGGSTITVYSAFDEGKNVRSMQGVAEDASTDLNDSAEGIYVCPIQIDENTVKYSPYSQAQYDVIKTYLPA